MDRDWTDKRMDDFAGRVDRFEASVDRRFDEVDRRFNEVDRRFDEVDKRFDKIDRRFERVDERFERADQIERERFGRIEARLDRWGRLIGGGVVTISAAVVAKLLGA